MGECTGSSCEGRLPTHEGGLCGSPASPFGTVQVAMRCGRWSLGTGECSCSEVFAAAAEGAWDERWRAPNTKGEFWEPTWSFSPLPSGGHQAVLLQKYADFSVASDADVVNEAPLLRELAQGCRHVTELGTRVPLIIKVPWLEHVAGKRAQVARHYHKNRLLVGYAQWVARCWRQPRREVALLPASAHLQPSALAARSGAVRRLLNSSLLGGSSPVGLVVLARGCARVEVPHETCGC